MTDELKRLTFPSQAKFRAWLDKNHAKEPGLWLKIAKKSSGLRSITYDEAVEVALCYGWIDGVMHRVDDDYFEQRFTPRRSRSRWSQINRDKAEALIATGEMQPAGLAEIERAKSDGRWAAAYGSSSPIEVPADLKRELKKKATARDNFEKLTKSQRYFLLSHIEEAKKPETRARRIAKYVGMLEAGEKPY